MNHKQVFMLGFFGLALCSAGLENGTFLHANLVGNNTGNDAQTIPTDGTNQTEMNTKFENILNKISMIKLNPISNETLKKFLPTKNMIKGQITKENLTFVETKMIIGNVTFDMSINVERDVVYTPTQKDIQEVEKSGLPVYAYDEKMFSPQNSKGDFVLTSTFFVPYSALPDKLVRQYDQPGTKQHGIIVTKYLHFYEWFEKSKVAPFVPLAISSILSAYYIYSGFHTTSIIKDLNEKLQKCTIETPLGEASIETARANAKFRDAIRESLSRYNDQVALTVELSAYFWLLSFAGGSSAAHPIAELISWITEPTVHHYALEDVEKGIEKITEKLDNLCVKTVEFTDYYKTIIDAKNSKLSYSPEGYGKGKILFTIQGNQIQGSGKITVEDSPEYAGVRPQKKGDCLFHYPTQEQKFSVSGTYSPNTKKALLNIPALTISQEKYCFNTQAMSDVTKSTKQINVLPWLSQNGCNVKACSTNLIEVELKEGSKVELKSPSGSESSSGDKFSPETFSQTTVHESCDPNTNSRCFGPQTCNPATDLNCIERFYLK